MNIKSPEDRKTVALIVGPTASGKSALALELAKRQASVVINADSAQVYRDLQILSARPTATEMQGLPHHLYGYIDGAETCTAARWADDAKQEIANAHDADLLPILVGGTGLYVRTLLDGISPIPAIDSGIRDAVRALDTAAAFDALRAEDPVAADRLHARDTTRIQRALEVVRSSGHPLDYWHGKTEGGIAESIALKPLVLLPPREWLYGRCDLRFEQMISEGAIEEVARLLDRNLPDNCPVMRAIGVADLAAVIAGKIEQSVAVAEAQTATRQYAKRQFTWFKNQCPAAWPRHEGIVSNDNIDDIITLLQ